MSLPLSGSISLSQINTELSRSASSQISLDSAENGTYAAVNNCSYYKPAAANPAAMSEWRGYDHNIMCPTTGYCGAGGKGLIQLYGANSATHTITVGNGPGFFRLRIAFFGVWPGQFPSYGTNTPVSWWRSRITVAGTSNDVVWSGSTLSGVSGYYVNIETDNPANYREYYSFIPSGSSQISIAVENYSPDLLLNYAYHVTCITAGSIVALHWSPDTFANACNSNFVYSAGSGETAVLGYSGYKNFLVSGNGTLSVGNAIYGYPSGSATSTYNTTNANSSDGYGYTGGTSYTYPTYNSAQYTLSGQTKASITNYSSGTQPLVAADGYYSDGTNWALVTGGAGVIASTGVCYYSLTWTISITTYYNDSQASISTVASYTGNGTWNNTSNVTNGAVISLYGYGHTISGQGGVTVEIYVDSVLQASSTADPTTSASYNLTMDGNHTVTINVFDSI